MGRPRYVTRRAEDGRWRCLQTRMRWPSEWSMALLNSERDGRRGGSEANRNPEFTLNSTARPPIHWLSWKGCERSQWDSVLGQGSACGYGRLFKSFFWLSCPFSKRNAHCKAPADALNVVTDYSWLTNRRAGSGPISPLRFTPMPLQGDPGATLTVGGVNCVRQEMHWLKAQGKMIQQLGLRC